MVIGRDMEIKETLEALLNNSHPRIAIMGFGGMGKTTLASKAFHNDKVQEKYRTRYFISCEGVLNVDQLWTKMAIAFLLKIQPSSPGGNRFAEAQEMIQIQNQILSLLKEKPMLLCLDSFETLWDSTKGFDELQEVLKRLNQISTLGLVITMRGIQGPGLINWKIVLLDQLTLNDSIYIFKSVTSKDPDENSLYILQELAGIPLAIHLFAAMVKDGYEDTESIRSRWKTDGTSIIERGEEGRLSQLDFSIRLSVDSPRMTSERKKALFVLAYLPSGLKNGPVLEGLNTIVPNFQSNLHELHRRAFVSLNFGRYIMLPPVARYCKEHLKVSKEVGARLCRQFSEFLNGCTMDQLKEESTNISSILMFGCQQNVYEKHSEHLVETCLKYTRCLLDYRLQPDQELIHAAFQLTSENYLLKASLWKILGEIQYQQYMIDEAIASFEKALNSYKAAENWNTARSEYANTFLWLGRAYSFADKFSEAEFFLKKTLVEFQQQNDGKGEASTFEELGNLYYMRDRLSDAQEASSNALALYEKIQNRLGQATSFIILGDLYTRMYKFSDAQEALYKAFIFFEEVSDPLGLAHSLSSLGNLYMRMCRFEDAQEALHKALAVYEYIQNRLGLANSYQSLGVLYRRMDRFKDAQETLHKALVSFEKIQNKFGLAHSLEDLGDLYVRMHRLEDAREALGKALVFYKEIQDELGQATCLRKLEEICMSMDKKRQV
ncbi:hypothetical protein GYMLUDRAFT_249859 [Collybiopsis luxurians FD-317 M1]|uniref:NB-ARC domain-containing protein n=1 Tax=Collybiopsis luxurians FD-317 M1 TaxID=944289 RepID=A0A0D0AUA3_9AGAR|nr:hypothetical protein GYMLUDRAFT_249859 [Collybiopsis luxurians FD-317 M1]